MLFFLPDPLFYQRIPVTERYFLQQVFLISAGADMTIIQTNTGETAKDVAQRKNHASIVEYLESKSVSRISSPG